jgi:DNA-binding LytR/AlgR family response regulator
VALAAVLKVEATERGNATVHLSNGTALACSRAWRKSLDQALLG